MLSIIVPVFNAEKFLKQCIDSIRNQTYREFELLLIDDGSDDTSVDICRKYQENDKRITLIKTKHAGPFFARKIGVENAKGDYVTFVDADDFVAKQSFAFAENDMHNNVDVISFDIYRYFGKHNIRYDKGWPIEKIYCRREIECEMYPKLIWDETRVSFGLDPSLCNKIFRTALIKKIFDKMRSIDFHYGEDVAVIYPLMKSADNISVHRQAYYYHRQRDAGVVPSYIIDDLYLDKLYALYIYLKTEMQPERLFRKQIDLFYIHSVNFAKKKYGMHTYLENEIFPFDRVNKGEKIVLYGAGNVGRLYMKQLSKLDYCDVVLWVDRYAKGEGIFYPDEIIKVKYDKIVIAILDHCIRKEIIEQLLQKGINNTKIVRRSEDDT